MSIFKPMLATDAELDKLRFPVWASPKLDGVRAVVREDVVYSRSNKPIPNKYVQALFKGLDWYDGELIVGSPTAHNVMQETMSGVMRVEGTPSVTLYAFDHVCYPGIPYFQRLHTLNQAICTSPSINVVLHESREINDVDSLLKYEQKVIDTGYEGLILRDPRSPYKMGRSTVKEGYLLKMKRFIDDEAEVIDFEERMHNGNEATVSELGRTKRSSHKAGKSGRGDLGALVVRSNDGVVFNIGTGFSDAERAAIWNDRDSYLGQLAKFKFFPVGVKEAPRHPVFLGWRNPLDT
jgi:DNA ligase 1